MTRFIRKPVTIPALGEKQVAILGRRSECDMLSARVEHSKSMRESACSPSDYCGSWADIIPVENSLEGFSTRCSFLRSDSYTAQI
jgi:hypothetical protein